MSGGPCTGACCAAFTLSQDVDDLEALVADLELEGQGSEMEQIADMVIELSAGEAVLRRAAFGGALDLDLDLDGGRRHYRCRHWDEGTRLCREYASRPAMCRDYPAYRGEAECSHCGAGGCGASS